MNSQDVRQLGQFKAWLSDRLIGFRIVNEEFKICIPHNYGIFFAVKMKGRTLVSVF